MIPDAKQLSVMNFLLSRYLDSVPVTAIEYFRQSAEKLIAERGAVEALAAALAHISGATTLEQRSLLNSDAVSKDMDTQCMNNDLIIVYTFPY